MVVLVLSWLKNDMSPIILLTSINASLAYHNQWNNHLSHMTDHSMRRTTCPPFFYSVASLKTITVVRSSKCFGWYTVAPFQWRGMVDMQFCSIVLKNIISISLSQISMSLIDLLKILPLSLMMYNLFFTRLGVQVLKSIFYYCQDRNMQTELKFKQFSYSKDLIVTHLKLCGQV